MLHEESESAPCKTLFLILTGFVSAILTHQIGIGHTPEPFRMHGIGDLPFDQDNAGGKKQAPAEEILDEQHGGKHHKMPPVVYSAVHTALVLHDEGLERAEKQDTDIITQEEGHGQHQKINILQNTKQIQNAE